MIGRKEGFLSINLQEAYKGYELTNRFKKDFYFGEDLVSVFLSKIKHRIKAKDYIQFTKGFDIAEREIKEVLQNESNNFNISFISIGRENIKNKYNIYINNFKKNSSLKKILSQLKEYRDCIFEIFICSENYCDKLIDVKLFCDLIIRDTNLTEVINIDMNGFTLVLSGSKALNINGLILNGELLLRRNNIKKFNNIKIKNINSKFICDSTLNVSSDNASLLKFLKDNYIDYVTTQEKYKEI